MSFTFSFKVSFNSSSPSSRTYNPSYFDHINCLQKGYMKKLKTLNQRDSMTEKVSYIKEETLKHLNNRNTAFFDRHDVYDHFIGMGPAPLIMLSVSCLKLFKVAYKSLCAAFCFDMHYAHEAMSALKESASYTFVAIASFLKSMINLLTKSWVTLDKGFAPTKTKRHDADYTDRDDISDILLEI